MSLPRFSLCLERFAKDIGVDVVCSKDYTTIRFRNTWGPTPLRSALFWCGRRRWKDTSPARGCGDIPVVPCFPTGGLSGQPQRPQISRLGPERLVQHYHTKKRSLAPTKSKGQWPLGVNGSQHCKTNKQALLSLNQKAEELGDGVVNKNKQKEIPRKRESNTDSKRGTNEGGEV